MDLWRNGMDGCTYWKYSWIKFVFIGSFFCCVVIVVGACSGVVCTVFNKLFLYNDSMRSNRAGKSGMYNACPIEEVSSCVFVSIMGSSLNRVRAYFATAMLSKLKPTFALPGSIIIIFS